MKEAENKKAKGNVGREGREGRENDEGGSDHKLYLHVNCLTRERSKD